MREENFLPEGPESIGQKPKPVDEILKSTEAEFTVKVGDIAVGETLSIQTNNTEYNLERRDDGFYMTGGSRFVKPTKVNIHGCTWDGSMLMTDVITEGMCLELGIPERPRDRNMVTTSTIKKIRINQTKSFAA